MALAAGVLSLSAPVFAADPAGKTEMPEEDDFQETPYTRYGEFNDEEDEEDDLRYMQYGRFFGVSLGVGYEGALGNKGNLYAGGFPTVELRVLYWFDFNFALAFGVMNSNHSYNGKLDARGDTVVKQYDLNLFRFGIDLRYYFDVNDAPAAVTFANPFLSGGVYSFTRTLTNAETTTDKDVEGSIGYSLGAGVEFAVRPKKTYFNLEGRVFQVNFSETRSPVDTGAGERLPNQSGLLYTVTGSVLFTW